MKSRKRSFVYGVMCILALSFYAAPTFAQALPEADERDSIGEPESEVILESPSPQEEGEAGLAGEADEAPPTSASDAVSSSAQVPPDDVSQEAQPSRRHPAPRYTLEGVQIEGAERTARGLIRRLVNMRAGDPLEPDDPSIESIRWRLMATGWFSDVRLALLRGSERGLVTLVVTVRERNTLLIRNLYLGLSQGLTGSGDRSANLVPYAGLGIAESNFLGTGLRLSIDTVLSQPQQGLRVAASYPFLYGRGVGLRGAFHFANTREFFGNSPQVSIACPPEFLETEDGCPEEITARNAVVFYRRGGLEMGAFSDVGPNSRVFLEWRGDLVHVRARPAAASEHRGSAVRPIDFAIENGYSLVSYLSASFLYETRDDPALPRRGTALRVQTDLGSRALGSDYEFLRVQARFNRWLPLGETQYMRIGAFAGFTSGAPPFFLKFHVADLTDLIPGRILGMNLDRRPTPNLLGTSIEIMRNEEFAARLDVEYGARIFAGEGSLRTLSAYVLVGIFSLSDAREMRFAVGGYEGLSRVPIDLSFDLGLRFDTPIGVFQLAFSNLLGFIEL